MPRQWYKDMIQQKYDEHKRRIEQVQSFIDQKHSKETIHVRQYLGRDKRRDRLCQRVNIDEENRLLIDRIGRAMSTKKIDNDRPTTKMLSFGEIRRKRELKKITEDNKKLLERIKDIEPFYNRAQWNVDTYNRERILRTMTAFPDAYVDRPMTGLGYGLSSNRQSTSTPSLPSLSSNRSLSQQHRVQSSHSNNKTNQNTILREKKQAVDMETQLQCQPQSDSQVGLPFDMSRPLSGQDLWEEDQYEDEHYEEED